jgi:hypothetical protein
VLVNILSLARLHLFSAIVCNMVLTLKIPRLNLELLAYIVEFGQYNNRATFTKPPQQLAKERPNLAFTIRLTSST